VENHASFESFRANKIEKKKKKKLIYIKQNRKKERKYKKERKKKKLFELVYVHQISHVATTCSNERWATSDELVMPPATAPPCERGDIVGAMPT
jgi:hypothetical protein